MSNNIKKIKKIIKSIRNRNTTAFTNCKTLEELKETINFLFETECDEIKFYIDEEAKKNV